MSHPYRSPSCYYCSRPVDERSRDRVCGVCVRVLWASLEAALTRTVVVIALLTLVGCVAPLRSTVTRPSIDDERVLELVRAAWREQGLAYSPTCVAEQRILSIGAADDEAMRYDVGYCATGSATCEETRVPGDAVATASARARAGCSYGICSAGSVLWRPSQPWPLSLGATWHVVVLTSAYLDPPTRTNALVHEYAHALDHCNGGSGRNHDDPRVWGRGGVVETVQRELRGAP